MASQAPRTPGELPAASVADLHERQDAERALVAAVVRRDRKAAAEFVAAHVDAIHGYVRHRLSSRTGRRRGRDTQDEGDHFFLCPLLPPGRTTP